MLAGCRLVAPQVASVMRAEAVTPASNGLVADHDTAQCEQFLNISKTEREEVIEQNNVRNDFRRKTKAMVDGSSRVHRPVIPVCR